MHSNMFIFFWLFTIIFQNIYLLLFHNNINSIKGGVNKAVIKYVLKDDDNAFEHSINVYKMGSATSKNVIVFISGGFRVAFDTYLQKIVSDLLAVDHMRNNYQLIVLEKLDKQTFISIQDFTTTVLTLHDQIKFEDLTIFGFSTGGIIASHVMASLGALKCKKKIITYDTPYQVIENVMSFENYTFYRPDFYFYHLIYKTYLDHYNYAEIKSHVKHDKWTNGSADFLKMMLAVHNISYEDFYKLSEFNLNQEKGTKLIQIYCECDPIVDRKICDDFINKHIDKFNDLNMVNDKKPWIGHCSDVWSPYFDIECVINHITR